MASGDLFGVGISGLLAYQRALATTSHNIANANTPGYSRQRAEFQTQPPLTSPNGYIGTGVRVSGIQRLYNEFLATQVRTGTSTQSQLQSYHALAAQVDNLLANPQSGLGPALGDFFNAVQGVADDPASTTARQVLLSDGSTLINRFRYIDQRLSDLRTAINTDLRNTVTEVNDMAASIARLNGDIALAQGSGQAANDLLDRRDQMIGQLAERVSVQVATQDDGMVNVFIGNGQTLVVGGQSMALTTVANTHDPTRYEVALQTGGNAVNVSNQISGGILGGALSFRREILDTAQNALGRVAIALSDRFNEQHRLGMDLNGQVNRDFFANISPTVHTGSNNAGSGLVTAAIADPGALTTSDYLVRYDGAGSWSVVRLSDNTTQSGAGPFNIDGLAITVGGAPSVGDSFLVQPTRNGASTIDLAISDPREVAAALPIRTGASLGNQGSASISTGGVLDPSNPNLLNTVTVNFVDPNNYQINGVGPLIPYTSGANIDINGWRVQVSGTPAAGDVFTVQSNAGGVSDNRNALQLAGLQTKLVMANGSASFEGSYGQLVADVGAKTRSAEINRDAQTAILGQAVAAHESVSGVNLDEEAANLLRFQQAYQAAAQVITTANTMFDTLLGMLRR